MNRVTVKNVQSAFQYWLKVQEYTPDQYHLDCYSPDGNRRWKVVKTTLNGCDEDTLGSTRFSTSEMYYALCFATRTIDQYRKLKS